ncbi:MAG: nuclear transport factor 2 family protein [Hyphomonadaceae bacterium]|nr:nuclear transport factor 2 family protein [Hyphomonadaceae bacterium]
MPTPQELMTLGTTLIDLCKAQKDGELRAAHYSQDAVSVEAMAMPDGNREAAGMEAINAKNEWWYGAHEINSLDIDGPYVHGTDRFSVIFDIDVTAKESGDRMQMREIGTYYVNDAGKITREEFYYAIGE